MSVYGLQEQIGIQEERKKGRTVTPSSRRRKGPAFLPSEHDDLPSGVAFMVSSDENSILGKSSLMLVFERLWSDI